MTGSTELIFPCHHHLEHNIDQTQATLSKFTNSGSLQKVTSVSEVPSVEASGERKSKLNLLRRSA